MKYPVFIHSEAGIDGYGVIIPDLPGCVSMGDSVEDAMEMAQEAAELHAEAMNRHGESLPEARSIEAIVNSDPDDDFEDGVWAFVQVGVPEAVAA